MAGIKTSEEGFKDLSRKIFYDLCTSSSRSQAKLEILIILLKYMLVSVFTA